MLSPTDGRETAGIGREPGGSGLGPEGVGQPQGLSPTAPPAQNYASSPLPIEFCMQYTKVAKNGIQQPLIQVSAPAARQLGDLGQAV